MRAIRYYSPNRDEWKLSTWLITATWATSSCSAWPTYCLEYIEVNALIQLQLTSYFWCLIPTGLLSMQWTTSYAEFPETNTLFKFLPSDYHRSEVPRLLSSERIQLGLSNVTSFLDNTTYELSNLPLHQLYQVISVLSAIAPYVCSRMQQYGIGKVLDCRILTHSAIWRLSLKWFPNARPFFG